MKDINEYKEYLTTLNFDQLEEISLNIDSDKFPDKYDAVLKEMEIKKPEDNPQEEKQEVKYAGFWRRGFARLLDYLILTPTFIIGYFLVPTKTLYILSSVLTLIIYFGYFVYFHGLRGQTVGKKVLNIKTVNKDFSPISYKVAFMREFIPLSSSVIGSTASFIALMSIPHYMFNTYSFSQQMAQIYNYSPPILQYFQMGISGIWMYGSILTILFTKKKKALHDMFAKTLVVYDENFAIPANDKLALEE